MTARLPVPRLVPVDVDALERRARELAAGDAGEEAEASGRLRLVAFRVRGRPCAVEASAVQRAVPLAAPFAVPLADGSERAVAFVDERPLAVVDLAGHAAGAQRRAAELRGSPAIVVETEVGPVAIAVDGPLELEEDHLAGTAPPADGALRIAGRLAGGGALLDAAWLSAWAGKAVRP